MVSSNCRRRVIYNHGLKLHQLRQILSEFEFTMIENNKNRFEIYNSNGDYITDVIKRKTW